MCFIVGGFVVISLVLGFLEIGMFIQPFLNLGLGYYVARQRNCDFRWADALKVIFATGTILVISTIVSLAVPAALGLVLISPLNAILSVFYIPYRSFSIFPKDGRSRDFSPIEDIKDLIDERKRSL